MARHGCSVESSVECFSSRLDSRQAPSGRCCLADYNIAETLIVRRWDFPDHDDVFSVPKLDQGYIIRRHRLRGQRAPTTNGSISLLSFAAKLLQWVSEPLLHIKSRFVQDLRYTHTSVLAIGRPTDVSRSSPLFRGPRPVTAPNFDNYTLYRHTP